MTSRSVALFLAVLLVSLLEMTSALDLPADGKLPLEVKVNKVETCPEYPHTPHSYTNLHMEMDPETDDLYISGTLNASEPLEPGIKGTVKIMRCVNEDANSCEKYVEVEVDDFCKHLPEEGKKWSPIVASLENFDPHCPVKPGVYELHEAPLSTKSSTSSQAMVGHWQIEVLVVYQERVMACLQADLDISVRRGRSRRK